MAYKAPGAVIDLYREHVQTTPVATNGVGGYPGGTPADSDDYRTNSSIDGTPARPTHAHDTVYNPGATQTAPTVTPTGGNAGAQSYKTQARGPAGQLSASSPAGSTAVGPDTLDATHYNTIADNGSPANTTIVKVFRTAGGPSQGYIGQYPAGGSFVDNGVAASTDPSPVAPRGAIKDNWNEAVRGQGAVV